MHGPREVVVVLVVRVLVTVVEVEVPRVVGIRRKLRTRPIEVGLTIHLPTLAAVTGHLIGKASRIR